MNDADRGQVRHGEAPTLPAAATALANLKPKGACWYCNQPLDNIRRFCGKNCADDYRTEEENFNGPFR